MDVARNSLKLDLKPKLLLKSEIKRCPISARCIKCETPSRSLFRSLSPGQRRSRLFDLIGLLRVDVVGPTTVADADGHRLLTPEGRLLGSTGRGALDLPGSSR